MKINRKIVLMLTIIILIGLLNIIPGQSLGKEITSFDNGGGQPLVEIELSGESGKFSDSTTYFSIPIHKGKIQEASLQITCMPNKYGSSLLNPQLDVGVDGDNEWEFRGKGYGAIGHQTLFTNGMNRKMVSLGNQKTNDATKIYLPLGAFVTDATMNLIGGNLKYDEIYVAVVKNNGEVHYIKSNGDKTFETPELIGSVGSNSYGIGMGDFDNDDDYDIVVNQGIWTSPTGNIYLFKKTGPGKSFKQVQNPVGFTGSSRNTGFAVADFDNDKNLDFIESEMGSNFYFFKGDGSNNFTRTQILSSFPGGTPWEKDVADFNMDGNLDLVVAGSNTGSVYVFEGNGDGTLKKAITVSTGTSGWWGTECVVAGDFDNDGNMDIMVKDVQFSNFPFIYIRGKGDLTFYSPQNTNIQFGNWNPRASAFDFNFDGYLDIMTFDDTPTQGTVKCYWGTNQGWMFNGPTTVGTLSWGIEGITTPPSLMLGGCDNLKIDVGIDGGEADFTFTGPVTTTEPIPDVEHPNKLKNVLNNILTSPPGNLRQITDDYGNILLEIPIRFTADEMGNVLLQNLSIQYSYTADVDNNPNNGNLVNELNDLIPSKGKGEFRIYFSVKSDQPGKAKLSNLYITFNEAPTTKPIPDFEIEEGKDYLKLVDLALYFNDDEELPEELRYSIQSYTNSNQIKVSIKDDHWLHVNATKEPDWYGETKVLVSAKDLGKGLTKSNEFTITINPVNDPPRVGNKLDNLNLLPNSISKKLDLDASLTRFFYDIDSKNLFFNAVIYDEDNSGKYEGYLDILIDNETNVLRISSLENSKNRIPVRVFCSDKENIREMNLSQLSINIPTYQHIIVNITNLEKGEIPTQPPTWKDIKDVIIHEDDSKINWINLNNYTIDGDDPSEKLVYTVDSVTNSAFINVFISTSKDRTENLLSIIPEQDYDGEAIVTLHVEDGDHNFAIETFKVTMIPKPDIPTVNIMSPTNNAVISGTIEIAGSAYDAENGLERVEVKIGNEPWQPVAGLEYWSIEWDSMEYTLNMDNIEIRARAIDLDNSYSVYDSIYIQILNIKIDSDSDGVSDIYDACPYDPLNWLDSDGDGVGDNSDHFIDDSTQWADRDGDGFGDNPSGNSYDKFPYDPTQWQDSDGDGLGDNPEGNNPDPNPKNPSQVTKSDDEIEYRIFTAENGPWLGLGLLIIVNILIFIYLINIFIKRKKENKIKSNEKSN